MALQVSTALVQTFRSNIEIGIQQRRSKLASRVRMEEQDGEYEYFDRINKTTARRAYGRHGNPPLISTPHERRRVSCAEHDWADLADDKDRLRMLIDPVGPYVENALCAFQRSMDDEIISAAFGTAYTGKNGETPIASGWGEVPVDHREPGDWVGPTNLTVGKLRKANSILRTNEARDGADDQTAVVPQKAIDSLLRYTEITSADYNWVKALVTGELRYFMGFHFMQHESLPITSNTRECLFFARSGLVLSTSPITVDVGPRPDKRSATQAYVCQGIGAVRMWEEKVVRVKTDESL